MESYPKDKQRYAFALVKAARTMPIDMAEKLDYIKQLRFNVQLKELKKESTEESLRTELWHKDYVSFDKR
tara:strand:- start:58 stop:267 length:210 start_codon:yes stop_codon:yes gene_type:complete